MKLYIGVDIHARQQTLSYLDTNDGTTAVVELNHERDDIRAYYSQFQGEVIVGIEASSYTNWFEELIEQLGHKLLVGDAVEIRRLARRRQKNDRRDAHLILDLLVHDEFPTLFRYSQESREVLRQGTNSLGEFYSCQTGGPVSNRQRSSVGGQITSKPKVSSIITISHSVKRGF